MAACRCVSTVLAKPLKNTAPQNSVSSSESSYVVVFKNFEEPWNWTQFEETQQEEEKA